MRVLVAKRGRRCLGKPCRDPDPHRAGDELQQRPAAGLVELVEPARKLFWQVGLAERAEDGDDFGQGGGRRVVVAVGGKLVITDSTRVIPLSLPSRASFARLGPRKGGGNGEGFDCRFRFGLR